MDMINVGNHQCLILETSGLSNNHTIFDLEQFDIFAFFGDLHLERRMPNLHLIQHGRQIVAPEVVGVLLHFLEHVQKDFLLQSPHPD